MAILANFAKAIVWQSGQKVADLGRNLKVSKKNFDHGLIYICGQ